MIRVFSHWLSARLIATIAIEVLVFILAIRLGLTSTPMSSTHDPGTMALLPASIFVLAMFIVMNAVGLYHADQWRDMQSVRLRLIAGAMLVMVLIIAVMLLPPSLGMDPHAFLVTGLAIFCGVTLVRYAFHKWLKLAAFTPRTLVLGTGSRVTRFAELAQNNRDYCIVGYVPISGAEPHHVPAAKILPMAEGESLASVVRRNQIDQIVIAVSDRRGKLPLADLLECKLQGIRITDLGTAFEREYRQVALESISAGWVMFEDGFCQNTLRTSIKRSFDLVASAILFVLTLPVLLVAMAAVYIESGGPIIYRQERVGQGGRPFRMYKLRSMRADAERDGTPRWAAAKDDRTTRVGRILRKLRIDELPQIINVIKGDMSFVGPRPERPFFVDQLNKQIPYYSLRHTVKPGITGWAQVSYPYGASLEDTTEKLKYDLYYVKNHALFLDLVILIATIEVVLTARGAR